MTPAPLKICLIMPSGGPERDYYGFEAACGGSARILMAISRVGGESGKDHELSALEETGRIDWILEAAERVVPFAPDVFHWACTSGSFIQGRAFADQQIAAIEALTGRAAGSTSLAFVAAAEAANARRVSVLATYPEPAARLFADFLDAFDIEVLSLDWLAAPSGWDAAKFAPAFVGEHARRALHAEAEALLIPDTALPSLHFLADLEAELGVPLLTANAVTLWDAQRLAGRFLPLPAYGRLLGGAFQ